MIKQGMVVMSFPPYWRVVQRPDDRKCIVVDTSVEPPIQVHGPAGRAACEQWARTTSLLYLTAKGSLLEDSVIDNYYEGETQ